MTNALILEDNLQAAEVLKTIILGIDGQAKVSIVSNTADAYRLALESDITLFLIDIILNHKKTGDVSGLEFANTVRRLPQYKFTDMIMVTALIDEKLYAYSHLHCYSYLEKPFDIRTAEKLIAELIRKPEQKSREGEKDRTVFIRSEGVFYALKEEEIYYIEYHSRYALVVTRDSSYKVHKSVVDDMIRRSRTGCFVQCSRFETVNTVHIEYVDFRTGILKVKEKDKYIKIGSNWKKSLFERMNSE